MKDARYPQNEAYLNHVQGQFEKAYPGALGYDETGKMIQPQAVIDADEVEGFDNVNVNSPDILESNPLEDIEPASDEAKSSGVTPFGRNASMTETARIGRDQADKEIRYIKRDRKRDEKELGLNT